MDGLLQADPTPTASLTCRSLAQASRLADALTALGHASRADHDSKGRPTLLTYAPSDVQERVYDADAGHGARQWIPVVAEAA